MVWDSLTSKRNRKSKNDLIDFKINFVGSGFYVLKMIRKNIPEFIDSIYKKYKFCNCFHFENEVKIFQKGE